MRKRLVLLVTIVVLIVLCTVGFFGVRHYASQKSGTDKSSDVVKEQNEDVVIIEESENLSEIDGIEITQETDSSDVEDIEVVSDKQSVSVGKVSFDLSDVYEQAKIGTDAVPVKGMELQEYDRENGLVVFGSLKKSLIPLDQYMYQITTNLIDTDTFCFQGKAEQKYGDYDWLLEIYKTDDKSTASLVACSEIDGQLICVFLHCAWTEYTETELVEILSSCAAS